MRIRILAAPGVVAMLASSAVAGGAADRPMRKPLSADERAAVIALMKAVDLAQDTDVVSPIDLPWETHVLKSTDVGYVPFRLALSGLPDVPKSAAMYVRVVSRHDGYRSTEEDSSIREWVMKGGMLPPPQMESISFGPGELPFGGPATSSSRRSVAAPAEASAVLALQERQFQKEKAAAEAAQRRAEAKQRDPYVFPFEEYYFFDVKSARVERAVAVPPGEYDLFVAVVDRARVKTSTPTVVRHTIAVPDFWNLELRLSSLILASDVRALGAPLAAKDQIEHPYTWGRAEVVPSAKTTFGRDEVLSVVYQVCNYGAPDTDVTADYNFYRRENGKRTLFNRTPPQQLTNDDLPLPVAWETQGFAMQSVPLKSFPPGDYELEVLVKDRLTRDSATQSITFTVK
jgi:hypothetical protein